MPYVPPTLNISAQYWDPNVAQAEVFASGSMPFRTGLLQCQIRPASARSSAVAFASGGQNLVEIVVPFDCPMLWPVFNSTEYQYWTAIVEAPLGSNAWYHVEGMFDVGFGFSNQHRVLVCTPAWVFAGSVFNTLPHWPWVPVGDLPNPWPASP